MLGRIFNILSAPLAGPRGRLVVGLLIVTGVAGVLLNGFSAGAAWGVAAQTGLALVFLVAVAMIYSPEGARLRTLAIAAPAVGAVVLALIFFEGTLRNVIFGGALGWMVAGVLLFRQQTPKEVHQAIRRMRRGQYDEAVEAADELIRRDKANPEHYRLRAMIFRLSGKLDRARRDYDAMLKYAGDDAVRAEAHNGLSEVHLQAGRLEEALQAAQKANKLFPDDWVTLYNLGLIEDRMARAEDVVTHLGKAFEVRIPDARQRLLAHLYLARAYTRLGDADAAQEQVLAMGNLWKGLEGLEKLLGDEQAAPLSAVLAEDAATARALMTDELTAEALA